MKKSKLPEIKNKGNVLLLGCILAGIVLRFLMLGSHPVTAQEASAASFSSASNPIQLLLNNMANNNEAPLYFILTYILTFITGFSEVSVRIMPAILGIVSVFVVNKLTRSFYSEKVTIIATSLFAISPFHIFYSQLSGPFTLQLVAMLLMLYYYMLSVKYNSFVMGPFIFWSVVSLYSGHLSLVLLLILNIILFIRYKEEIRINLWIRAQIFILLAWLPLIAYFIKGSGTASLLTMEKILAAPLVTFKNLLLGYTLDMNFLTIIVAAAASIFLLIGVVTCRTIKEKRMTDIMSLVLFLTVGIAWLSALLTKSVYTDSHFLLAGTMLIILVSIGFSHLSREGMVLLTLIIGVFFTLSIVNYFNKNLWSAPDYKALYLEIVNANKESDMIVHSNAASYGPFEFYNRLVYKRNFENRILGTIPEYKGSKSVRETWRKINSFLGEKAGMGVYAGYDKNILTEIEAKASIRPGARFWYVTPDTVAESAVKQADMTWTKGLTAEKTTRIKGAQLTLLVKK